MSHLLWKYFWENDVEKFRRLLAPAGQSSQSLSKSPAIGSLGSPGTFHTGGSPLGASPRPSNKGRRVSGPGAGPSRPKTGNTGLGRAEVNSRDYAGLTVLLRAASSAEPNACDFVRALIDHSAIDIYAQDTENGWNALHRALYFGNASIARMLLQKEREFLISHNVSSASKVGMLIKTKDHEGNSPFDVYNSTVADQVHLDLDADSIKSVSEDEADEPATLASIFETSSRSFAQGDELFVFGSNKNLSLGAGDEDDRQYPERIILRRPDHLVRRLHDRWLDSPSPGDATSLSDVDDIPSLIREEPAHIQDVVMSKFHTAVLTTDPCCNLYVSGIGRGGRLGLGDENTRFSFIPVQGPLVDKKIQRVALGQNHSMVIADNGELWTWGLNTDSQLGYILPTTQRVDDEPSVLVPRQVFGALKKELVLGIAASSIHSVAFTSTSMYCWGRNAGQLALMDADSRSLEVQQTPRRVAASLFSAPIEMVSAIDKATVCLLRNSTVWVFTQYGYNLIKFPYPDVFVNSQLSASSFTNRYDPGRREISYIASGGETIAAVNSCGDLYTMQLSQSADTDLPAGSTTNPVKIKGAVTQPQCIWDSRKDGVVSVGVGEHGSVLICTKSGAVWQRVKRTKGKSAGFAGFSDVRRKDFKFQRVPYITSCTAVRSSTFGACSAIREDNTHMQLGIKVAQGLLRDDVASLMCLNGFTSNIPKNRVEGSEFWLKTLASERLNPMVLEILHSSDLEAHLHSWLKVNSFQFQDFDSGLRSSLYPDIVIPVHSWVLSARSLTLRAALSKYRRTGEHEADDAFHISSEHKRLILTVTGADIYTILNVVLFAYADELVPVWKGARAAPSQAHRFRQVRLEVMKLATKLQMPALEAASRLQVALKPTLTRDMRSAMGDPRFFEDSDVILEIDGAEIPAHSQLIRKRCPFFEGIFHGRSRGQWLASRRDETEASGKVSIDLKHVGAETFQHVLAYMYGDVDDNMFNEVALANVDEFCDLVLDVMGVANELMLDRLSQICQALIGKFVTTRNVAGLLNEISACSVTDFTDAGLVYICLQLEALLENHLLDGLDEDLLEELDVVVRDRQSKGAYISRDGETEVLLHELDPNLIFDIQEERQTRIREMAFKAAQRDEDKKVTSSNKARAGVFDELRTTPRTPDSAKRRTTFAGNEPFSPSLRPKASQGDLIFDMDEDESAALSPSPALGASRLGTPTSEPIQRTSTSRGQKWKHMPGSLTSPQASPNVDNPLTPSLEMRQANSQVPSSSLGTPWASAALATDKLDLKNIMTETTSQSALTSGLKATGQREVSGSKSQAKISQKEKKRQMQAQAEAEAAVQGAQESKTAWDEAAASSSPWKVASPSSTKQPKATPASGSIESTQREAISASAKPLVASETSRGSTPRRTASPDTRFSGQGRTNSSSAMASSSSPRQQRTPQPLVPHSKSYIKPAPKAESWLGFSMDDIIVQQAREQELVREAVAKRSLQEIQQEQEFQQWWDQESRRAQEEETKRQTRGKDREREDRDGRRGRRGRGGGKARGGAGVSGGGEAAAAKGSGSVGGQGGVSQGRRAQGSGSRGGRGAKGKDGT